MNFITFAREFKSILERERETNLQFDELYNNRTQYTCFIKRIMSEDITRIMDAKYNPEYFTIDHTWWRTQSIEAGDINYYDWEFVCAVEHENDWRDWTYEVAKLDSINVPLKIVIGYVENSKRDKEIQYLSTQKAKLKNTDDGNEFGVILMNRDLINEGFGFSAYLLTEADVKVVSI